MDEHIKVGARLYARKRKYLDKNSILTAEIKAWDANLKQLAQEQSRTVFEIAPTEDQLEELGPHGCFLIKQERNYNNFSKENLDDLNVRYFTSLFPNANQEETRKWGLEKSKWMWNNRGFTVSDKVERAFSVKQPKPSKVSAVKTQVDLPATFEEVRGLRIVQETECAMQSVESQ
jgi:hypothetical protein